MKTDHIDKRATWPKELAGDVKHEHDSNRSQVIATTMGPLTQDAAMTLKKKIRGQLKNSDTDRSAPTATGGLNVNGPMTRSNTPVQPFQITGSISTAAFVDEDFMNALNYGSKPKPEPALTDILYQDDWDKPIRRKIVTNEDEIKGDFTVTVDYGKKHGKVQFRNCALIMKEEC